MYKLSLTLSVLLLIGCQSSDSSYSTEALSEDFLTEITTEVNKQVNALARQDFYSSFEFFDGYQGIPITNQYDFSCSYSGTYQITENITSESKSTLLTYHNCDNGRYIKNGTINNLRTYSTIETVYNDFEISNYDTGSNISINTIGNIDLSGIFP